MKTGVELIADERKRQIEEEGWTPEHDDEHTANQLSMAGALYAAPEPLYAMRQYGAERIMFKDPWPWDKQWDKRQKKSRCLLVPAHQLTKEERIRNLSKAGALIAAEIDRLQRDPQSKQLDMKLIKAECLNQEKDIVLLYLTDMYIDYRIMREDGTNYVGTCDFRSDRLNLEFDNNICIKIEQG